MKKTLNRIGWIAVTCILVVTFLWPGAPNKTAAQSPKPMADHKDMANTISLDEAMRVINAAEKKARDINKSYDVAVVDAGGNLVAFHRMDGAWLGSIELAINKAYTSRVFNISTKDLAGYSQPGSQFYGIQTQPRIVVFAGGIPLKRNGQVVGAIGASGGFSQEDQSVAEAGAGAF